MPGFALDRDGSDQDRALGKPPGALVIEADAAVSGDGQEPLGGRTVGPELGIDRVRDHARRRLVVARRGEQAGLAQPAREVVRRLGGRVGDQAIDLVRPVVVEQVELAVVGLAEGHQMERRPGELPLPGDRVALVREAPR